MINLPLKFALLALAFLGIRAWAAEPAVDPGAEEIRVTATREAGDETPADQVDAVFGFDKSLLETPRSASVISAETLEQFGVTELDDLVVLTPGSFTQSFFGVAGTPDLRGTSGESYFNGVRRLDNPGNYMTPFSAAERVDIVRGPASVVHGPSKIGGYMNFIPKSARADAALSQAAPTGAFSLTGGSWSKAAFSAELGGPGTLGERAFGYYLYGAVEDSGSHYRHTGVESVVLQGSINMDLGASAGISFGGMYQDYRSNEVAGWNRLTQALVDDGLYRTGLAKPLDGDGDGYISHQEFDAANGGNGMFAFIVDPAGVAGPVDFAPDFALDPATTGEARLDSNQVLVDPEDILETDVLLLYLDLAAELNDKWSLTNKLYYEGYDNVTEAGYGFSQFSDSWVIENQLILKYAARLPGVTLQALFSPSVRYTDFENASDYTNENFHRRDLTRPHSARDRRLLSTRIDDDYTDYFIGHYAIYGLAALADLSFDNGLGILLGARHDLIDLAAKQPGGKTLGGLDLDASDTESVFSWTASVSYRSAPGIVPYVTVSEQTTVVAGQGADIDPANIAGGQAVAGSRLLEVGVKGSFLDERLFTQLAWYEQERTDFSAQAIVTNQASKTEGVEFELRWRATPALTLSAAYTNIEVINLSTAETGGRFSFLGAGDLPDTDPAGFYGGTAGGFVTLATNPKARRAGLPENVLSLGASYDFHERLRVFGTVVDVESVYSGFSHAVKLPSYTLVNAGIEARLGRFSLAFTAKNLTDERYFRANFPNLFGSVLVLPELPRHYQASLRYRF